jgi:hypothetical protein
VVDHHQPDRGCPGKHSGHPPYGFADSAFRAAFWNSRHRIETKPVDPARFEVFLPPTYYDQF